MHVFLSYRRDQDWCFFCKALTLLWNKSDAVKKDNKLGREDASQSAWWSEVTGVIYFTLSALR